MRQVLSLSLPTKSAKQIKILSKKRGFDTVSGYVKYLLESDQDLISADDLLESAQEAKKEYKNNKTIVVKSMVELL